MLFIPVIVFAGLLTLAWLKVKRHGQKMQFIYRFGFLIGAFVWEDLLVISMYGLVASLITYLLDSAKVGLLLFLVFWVVRSGGEALYFFLQQFVQPTHFPHFIEDHFALMRRILGPLSYQQCLIIMQVFFQIVMMAALAGLFLLGLYWQEIA
jgi:hypothetical protein